MGTETGKIIGKSTRGITVRLTAGEQCGTCAAKSLCAFQEGSTQWRFLVLPESADVPVGSQVELEYPESSRILAAVLVFLLPLVFLVGGYVIGERLSFAGGIAGAITGFFLSGGVLALLNRRIKRSRKFLPKIKQVYKPPRTSTLH